MEHALILAIFAVALVLFATETLRPDIVAMGVTATLLVTGTLTVAEAFSGFSNPAVITVICMFILSHGLVRTGVADQVALGLLRVGGTNPAILTAAVMVTVGVMSMFMNNIGAVAILLPVMFAVARQANYPVARLLIPLSFGSLLGGLSTLIGTPPNLLASMALEDAGFQGLALFDYAPTGLALMAAGTIYLVFVGRFLIPAREVAGDLTRQYRIENYLSEVVLPEGSPLVGKTVASSRLRHEMGLLITSMRRAGAADGERFVPGPDTPFEAGDQLVVEGNYEDLIGAKSAGALELAAERKFGDRDLAGAGVELAEAVVAPGSTLVGRTIKRSDVRRRYGILVLGLRRRGGVVRGDFVSIPLETGDVLLVQGSRTAVEALAGSRDFLVVQRLALAARDRSKAPLALAIMAGAVLTAATGVLHISASGLIGVLLMAVTGCVRVEGMYEAVEWRVIFLIACMMPLGIAMDAQHAGTAAWLANHVVRLTGDSGPLMVMAALFLFTTLLTEVMSNAAATVLVAPIAIAIAVGLGLQPHPFVVAVAIAASTTFLTPIGHQANVLVYGAGNYRFSDFARVGALLNVILFIVAMIVVPMVWPFEPLAPSGIGGGGQAP